MLREGYGDASFSVVMRSWVAWLRGLYCHDRMDVNVHAAHTKPTESRLIGCADFVGVTRRFTCARQGIVGWVMDFAHRGAYQSCGAAASD